MLKKLTPLYYWLLQPALVLGILGAGVFGVIILGDKEKQQRPPMPQQLVTIAEAQDCPAVAKPMRIDAYGQVRAANTFELSSQVSGRVTYIHPNLRVGGLVPAGQPILIIDPTDYEQALQQVNADIASANASIAGSKVQLNIVTTRRAQNEVARAQAIAAADAARATLDLEIAQAQVAIDEWHSLHPDTDPPSLLAREPQIKNLRANYVQARHRIESAKLDLDVNTAEHQQAEANLLAEEAKLAQVMVRKRMAETNLARTTLTVPYDSVVETRQIDIGQLANANQRLATLYEKDTFELVLPISADKLTLLSNGKRQSLMGRDAAVWPANGDASSAIQAHISRFGASMDAATRNVELILHLENPAQSAQPILPGTYLQARLLGDTLEDVQILKPSWLHSDNTIYLAKPVTAKADTPVDTPAAQGDENSKHNAGKRATIKPITHTLVLAKPTIRYRDAHEIWVQGLNSNLPVITSRIPQPKAGMPLHIATVDNPTVNQPENQLENQTASPAENNQTRRNGHAHKRAPEAN